jgi:phosphoenolpyruvate-protein kinase (PTS system EI component)
MATPSATTTGPRPSEVRLFGRSISPGLGMGPAWVVGDVLKSSGPSAPISQNEVDGELSRLARSFEGALAEVDQYAQRIEAEFDSALAGIFRAHGAMLRELLASGEFERESLASNQKRVLRLGAGNPPDEA